MLILKYRWLWTLSLVALGWVGVVFDLNRALQAAAPAQAAAASSPLTADALAAQIDTLIAAQLKVKHVQPAVISENAEFIRRVYLDLAGCIPSVADVRDFLDDSRPDKRRLWIEELLQGSKPSRKSDAYARHFASVWRAWLLARLNDQQVVQQTPRLETWLYQHLQKNTPYDWMVRALLTGKQPNPAKIDNQTATADAFLQANQNKPVELAMSTARLFLGVQMDCARCHEDRSGGPWTQADFWSYAACFVETTKTLPKITIEGTQKTVSACFPGGRKPQPRSGTTSRQWLSQWLTASTNPYFARASVNRLWSYFFGIGLVDPADAGGDHNPPSHPELLDLLAQQFTLHQFDLKYLLQAITNSQTYQRTSRVDPQEKVDSRLFSRMAVRALSVEQLFNSLAEATELFDPTQEAATGLTAAPRAVRQRFLELFVSPEQRAQPQTSILQALFLMNSDFIADRTRLGSNPALAAIADAAQGGTARQIETLYLMVLSRQPHADEAQLLVDYVDRAGQPEAKRQALADVFWVLLNSTEFRHNH